MAYGEFRCGVDVSWKIPAVCEVVPFTVCFQAKISHVFVISKLWLFQFILFQTEFSEKGLDSKGDLFCCRAKHWVAKVSSSVQKPLGCLINWTKVGAVHQAYDWKKKIP